MEKISVTITPSPISKLNSSFTLNNNVYIKRDDLLGAGLGGNKLRKLEYLFAKARSLDKKLIITHGSLQTNHGMLTALCSSKLNIPCVLYLLLESEEQIGQKSGNFLLNSYLDANLEIINVIDIMENSKFSVEEKDALVEIRLKKKITETIENYLQKYNINKDDIFYIDHAGSTPEGILGYVDCVKEIKNQSDISFDYIFCGNGSGGTYAGILLGCSLYSPNTKVIAVNIEEMSSKKPDFIRKLIKNAQNILNTNVKISDFLFLNNAIGNGYAIPDKDTIEFIKNFAKNEGIFLDPIYTGKIFRGAFDYIKEENQIVNKNILILHSGGIPGIFNDNMVSFVQEVIY